MNTEEKLDLLAAAARYDLSCECNSKKGHGRKRDPKDPRHRWIYPATLPNGNTMPVLKVLQTNYCKNNCAYCALSAANSKNQRASFTPEELSRIFIQMVERHLAFGIFLSAATGADDVKTMQDMIKTIEILRFRYKFRGYVHLKVLPLVSADLVERAVFLADRVSVNLEAPSSARLSKIAGCKNFTQTLKRMQWIKNAIEKKGQTWRKGQTTQFVVGAAGESDKEIMETTSGLYKGLGMKRIYYSAFQPVPNSPLEGVAPVPLIREHRLYQSEFLLRKYGFKFEEIPFDKAGHLSLEEDPKMVYAKMHPELFPMEINKASYPELLRIPGIGPTGAYKITQARKHHRISYIEELKHLGIRHKKVVPFILLSGKAQSIT